MKHLRYLETWPEVDGEPATERELMDRWDMVVLGEHPAGGWIADCLGRGLHDQQLTDDLPGVRLRSGTGEVRYRRLPEDCHPVCYHQTVYRDEELDVRSAAAVHAGRDGPPPQQRSPKGRGPRTSFEHARPDTDDLVEGAEREVEQGRARRRRVPAADVRSTDVVASDPAQGHRWAGEPPTGPGSRSSGGR